MALNSLGVTEVTDQLLVDQAVKTKNTELLEKHRQLTCLLSKRINNRSHIEREINLSGHALRLVKDDASKQGEVFKTLLFSNSYYHAIQYTDIIRGLHYKKMLAHSILARLDIDLRKVKLCIFNIKVQLDFIEEKMIIACQPSNHDHDHDGYYLNIKSLEDNFPVS